MSAVIAATDREMMEKSSGIKLFKQIEKKNFAGMVEMLSQSKIGLEYLDEIANTPFLYACYLGRHPFVKYLAESGANIKRINVFGQNALAMATYSGDRKTCEYLLSLRSFDAYNKSSICSPMCVAVIVENIELVKYFTKFEYNGITARYQCHNSSIHGMCPMKLAMLQKNTQIVDILRRSHQCHFIH